MIEIILGIFVIVVVGFYLFRPTSKQEEKDLKSKNNWRGGFKMEKIFGIVVLIFFTCNLGYTEPVTIKKTKWHHMDIKEHFEIVDKNVRAGKSAQKFEIRHGECKKQDCKWVAQRTERH